MHNRSHGLAALAAAALIGIASSASAAEWESVEFYPFAKATLTYKISGIQSGSQVELVRDHGRETATFVDSSMSMMGMNRQTKTGSWMTKDWIYNYDYKNGQGSKIANPMKDALKKVSDPKEAYTAFMTGFGGKKAGKDTYNGTPCTVWEIAAAHMKMCVSDKLIMQYSRMDMGGGMQQNIELVDAKIGTVDESRFTKPKATYNEVQMPAR